MVEDAGRRLYRAAPPNSRVILFGSAARGELGVDSDLDFLVIERDVEDRDAEMVRLTRALRPLRIPIDVLVYSETYVKEWGGAKGSIVHTALTEGSEFSA